MDYNGIKELAKSWMPVVGAGGFVCGIVFWFRDLKNDVNTIKDNHLTHIQHSLDGLNDKLEKLPEAIAASIVNELREQRQDIRDIGKPKES